MKKPARCALLLGGLLLAAAAGAQDFGFGFAEDEGEGSAAGTSALPPAMPVSVKVGGEVAAEFLGFVHDFGDKDKAKAASLGDVVSGSLSFSASGANVDAFIGLTLSAASLGSLFGANPGNPVYTPLILDEAFLRAWFGPVNIEAGLRKLTWGKADSLGPLDIVNPLDYGDLTRITDIKAIKIARPMLHVSWNMDNFSKLEAVFIPNFAGHRFATDAANRWTPGQFGEYLAFAETGIYDRALDKYGSFIAGIPGFASMFNDVRDTMLSHFGNNPIAWPATGGLEYAQTGLRYTTTIGSIDLGAQYFYGNLFRPDFSVGGVDLFLEDLVNGVIPQLPAPTYTGNPALLSPQLKYNRYHQLGLDYAQVLAGFNLRAEFAVHLTEDFAGDDGSVRNPFLGWSLGFDRDLVWGINANIQCNETIRLLNNKVGSNPALDCEAGTEAAATRITAQLSKKFLKDNLECKVTNIWDIEDSGCYIIPAIVWTIKDITAELSAGVFAGKESAEMGQYWENSFVKLGMKYSF
jgi:hypothetical protein